MTERNAMELAANEFDAKLRQMCEEAAHIWREVVPCVGPEFQDWQEIAILLDNARQRVQRSRHPDDREVILWRHRRRSA